MVRKLILVAGAALALWSLGASAQGVVSVGQNPQNSNSIACTLSTGTTLCGPFAPSSPNFHISHAPSGFTATCQTERKTDGANWAIVTITAGGSTTQMGNWSFSSGSQPISEDFNEPQTNVQYRVNCTSVSGGTDVVTFSY